LFGESFSGDHPLVITILLLISEVVSIFVRPLTLSVRMVVNIVIGQVGLSLVGGKLCGCLILFGLNSVGRTLRVVLLSFFFFFLFFVEVVVVIIQTFIFCILLVFYGEDGVVRK